MVKKADWYWSGYPGHFIGGANCCFFLNTRVGNYRISTVGDYRPNKNESRETIGAGKDDYFETMVFKVINNGYPEGEIEDYCEIDGVRYRESRDAEEGHYQFCQKYSRRRK